MQESMRQLTETKAASASLLEQTVHLAYFQMR
jgi:hypothetical protein